MYLTKAEIIEEFGEKGVPSGLSDEHYSKIISRTGKFIDSYLRSASLNTPLTDTDAIAIIKGAALDIARYYSWADKPSDHIKDRYDKSVSWLEKVAAGKVRIFTPTTESRKSGFQNITLVRS